MRGFSPCTLVFPSPQKPAFPNSSSSKMAGEKPTYVDVLPLNCYNAFIYLFIIYLFIYYSHRKKKHRVHAPGNKLLPAYNLKDKGL